MDDFALFHSDRHFLSEARVAIEAYLESIYLTIHPVKSQLFQTKHGSNFVGFRVLGNQLKIRGENLRRGRRRLKHMQKLCRLGKMERERLDLSLQSWFAHLAHVHTWYLRQKIMKTLE